MPRVAMGRFGALAFACSFAVALAGCTSFVQTSSGADYLAKADAAGAPMDETFKAAANVEPLLTFPARIGVARIENGVLTDIPAPELDLFMAEFAEDPRNDYAPVNPFIAALVAQPSETPDARRRVIETLRLAGARQHLDAIFVYETATKTTRRNGAGGFLALTIIGGYLAPTERLEAAGAASGVLFDVRNGYPYGQVTTSATDTEKAPVFLAGGEIEELGGEARLAAVGKLANEARLMLGQVEGDLARLGAQSIR